MRAETTMTDDVSKSGRHVSGGETVSEGDMAAKTTSYATEHAPVLSFFKLFWIFLIGSIVGLVLEQLYCFLLFGDTQSRAGLMYGPFSPIYGFGAVIITALLYRLHDKGDVIVFVASGIVGSAFEFATSIFLQFSFGTFSWDYSNKPFNIDGRICLEAAVMWGILGLIWLRLILPHLSNSIDRIPLHIRKPLTVILAVFMALDIVVTFVAVERYTQRQVGDTSNTPIEKLIDDTYPDERITAVFANMKLVKRP